MAIFGIIQISSARSLRHASCSSASNALSRSRSGRKPRWFHSSSRNEQEGERFDLASIERAADDVDVCIVGAGPAGLSAAIRLKQLEKEHGKEIRVVVLEKGPDIGEHFSQRVMRGITI